MNAISLWQPWASLMALGVKKVETRGWYMRHRGRLAIAATARWDGRVHAWLGQGDEQAALIRRLLAEHGYADWRDLPLGAVLCTVEVLDCRPTEVLRDELSEIELALGDYRAGRFGIITTNLLELPEPIRCRGQQGLWDWAPAANAVEESTR